MKLNNPISTASVPEAPMTIQFPARPVRSFDRINPFPLHILLYWKRHILFHFYATSFALLSRTNLETVVRAVRAPWNILAFCGLLDSDGISNASIVFRCLRHGCFCRRKRLLRRAPYLHKYPDALPLSSMFDLLDTDRAWTSLQKHCQKNASLKPRRE